MIMAQWKRGIDGQLYPDIPDHSPIKCPHCQQELVQHIWLDGWRNHVLSYHTPDQRGKFERCSVANCEINHICPK